MDQTEKWTNSTKLKNGQNWTKLIIDKIGIEQN